MIGRESVFDHPVALNFEEREILVNALYSVCRIVDISYLWRPNLKDEGDNFIVELEHTNELAHTMLPVYKSDSNGYLGRVLSIAITRLLKLPSSCSKRSCHTVVGANARS